ncbi:MAG: ribosome silencing factor [Rhodobacteraceae bacterium]|nr:ribosome silencing factor [Paracoccaceae bacterium]
MLDCHQSAAIGSHFIPEIFVSTKPEAAITPAQPSPLSSDALLALILSSLNEDAAEDVVSIPLAGKSEVADHMVVASGRSSRHVGALSEKMADRIKQASGMLCRTEGKQMGDWVLVDCGDVIVHIFRPEVRDFYDLEKLWSVNPRDNA